MSRIKKILAREVIDSRGNPTIEAEVHLESGVKGRAISPSGASTGTREALELRDERADRYNGKGVQQAVGFACEEINDLLTEKDVHDQVEIDTALIELDGTPDKSRLGANSILAVSLASCKASAEADGIPLFQKINNLSGGVDMIMPTPMMNIINGGEHADNNLDIQEFMIQPVSMNSFKEALRCGVEVFHSLKEVLRKRGLSTAVGDEGGFAPDLASNEEALECISESVEKAGYKPGKDVVYALDCAASEFYSNDYYELKGEGRRYTSEEFSDYLNSLCSSYPISSIEDALDESDWSGWAYLTKTIGDKVQLVGDDLFVTNTEILKKGINENVANAILIKFNQIGTLTETLGTIEVAKQAGYSNVVSHRSGESEDTTIADLSVGTGVGQIKTGSLCRTDRTAKYNQLLRIEEAIGATCSYEGYRTIKNM